MYTNTGAMRDENRQVFQTNGADRLQVMTQFFVRVQWLVGLHLYTYQIPVKKYF